MLELITKIAKALGLAPAPKPIPVRVPAKAPRRDPW